MRLRILKYPAALAAIAAAIPFIASAQSLEILLLRARTTANTIIGLLFIIATLVFLWGIVKFIASAGDETERKKSRGLMTWGILGLAVMAAAWGITALLVEYFGVPSAGPTFRPPPINPYGL